MASGVLSGGFDLDVWEKRQERMEMWVEGRALVRELFFVSLEGGTCCCLHFIFIFSFFLSLTAF